jgi:hypothetical protein
MRTKTSPSSLLASLLFATFAALCAQNASAWGSDSVTCKKASNGYGGLICSPSGAVSCKVPTATSPFVQCNAPQTGVFECRVDEKGVVTCYSSALSCVKSPSGASVDCTVK